MSFRFGSGSSSDRTNTDEDRVPPGQYLTQQFPVLQAGPVHHVRQEGWVLKLTGLIEPRSSFTWDELLDLPAVEQTSDIHCVTRWTKLDTHWKGVPIRSLLEGTSIAPEAKHVVVRAERDWTTNLPLEELLRDDVLVAYEYEGRPLSDEHGGPVRLVVPRLYFWKSAKWLQEIEFVAEQRLGYWESVGYHELGDPWLEQRYS
jgi:DMSO/TMAO reductase YedYZ molybdopterin-dependent catalytic subunit